MASVRWTPELQARLLACTDEQLVALSEELGVSEKLLKTRRVQLRIRADAAALNGAEVIDELRAALNRTQSDLKKQRDRTDLLVAATISGARDAMLAHGPIVPVATPRLSRKGNGGQEVALWHLTDWQGGKLTTTYNSAVMRTRVGEFVRRAQLITEIQRAAHPVDEVVILFGGDMIEGMFNFPSQVFEIDSSLFGMFTTVSRLLVDTVRSALGIYKRVRVVSEWGNHGRIGSKRDAVPRSDNFDRMCYELARQLLSGEKRLTWEDSEEDIQRVEVGAYRALLIHGDEVGRNGYASPSTMVQHVNRWRSGAYPWAFRDVYSGHYHTHAQWPMANGVGNLFQTGSVESENRYALVNMAASAVPTQRLHFIDPDAGRVTGQYQIWLEKDRVIA